MLLHDLRPSHIFFFLGDLRKLSIPTKPIVADENFNRMIFS